MNLRESSQNYFFIPFTEKNYWLDYPIIPVRSRNNFPIPFNNGNKLFNWLYFGPYSFKFTSRHPTRHWYVYVWQIMNLREKTRFFLYSLHWKKIGLIPRIILTSDVLFYRENSLWWRRKKKIIKFLVETTFA